MLSSSTRPVAAGSPFRCTRCTRKLPHTRHGGTERAEPRSRRYAPLSPQGCRASWRQGAIFHIPPQRLRAVLHVHRAVLVPMRSRLPASTRRKPNLARTRLGREATFVALSCGRVVVGTQPCGRALRGVDAPALGANAGFTMGSFHGSGMRVTQRSCRGTRLDGTKWGRTFARVEWRNG